MQDELNTPGPLDPLESALHRIPLRPPSEDLDRRVLAARPRGLHASRRLLGAAAAAVVALGAASVWMALRPREGPSPEPTPSRISILLPASRGNPFDFTGGPDLFPAGKVSVTINAKGI